MQTHRHWRTHTPGFHFHFLSWWQWWCIHNKTHGVSSLSAQSPTNSVIYAEWLNLQLLFLATQWNNKQYLFLLFFFLSTVPLPLLLLMTKCAPVVFLPVRFYFSPAAGISPRGAVRPVWLREWCLRNIAKHVTCASLGPGQEAGGVLINLAGYWW